jgi:hypothetical protein
MSAWQRQTLGFATKYGSVKRFATNDENQHVNSLSAPNGKKEGLLITL